MIQDKNLKKILVIRRVRIYQRGNHNPYIEEEQTTQWPKENVQKDKQRSTKHAHKTKKCIMKFCELKYLFYFLFSFFFFGRQWCYALDCYFHVIKLQTFNCVAVEWFLCVIKMKDINKNTSQQFQNPIEKSWKQRQNQYRKQNIFKISIANNILQHLQTPFLFH